MPENNKALTPQTQFSVFLVNKPGMLARLCQHLASDKVNVVAMSMMDSTEHGVLRVVAENPDAMRTSLATLDLPVAETTVLLASVPNRPGGLADVVERLASAHITVNYAYLTTGARNGKTFGVFRVSDARKAEKILGERRPKRKLPTSARDAAHTRRTH
ncbi:MAG: amino acid-binding protein [Phycisphaerae bacterium]|nr:amino acid-binding protein [Phycisphaerae bacterium]